LRRIIRRSRPIRCSASLPPARRVRAIKPGKRTVAESGRFFLLRTCEPRAETSALPVTRESASEALTFFPSALAALAGTPRPRRIAAALARGRGRLCGGGDRGGREQKKRRLFVRVNISARGPCLTDNTLLDPLRRGSCCRCSAARHSNSPLRAFAERANQPLSAEGRKPRNYFIFRAAAAAAGVRNRRRDCRVFQPITPERRRIPPPPPLPPMRCTVAVTAFLRELVVERARARATEPATSGGTRRRESPI